MAARHRGQRPHRAAGQATVELVVALPVVVLLLLAVLQVAVVVRAQVAVVEAARQGARAAAVEGTATAARGAVAASPGLRPGRADVAVSIDRRPGGLARVRVRYRAPTDVPLVGPLVGSPTLEAEVAMLVEGAGPPSG